MKINSLVWHVLTSLQLYRVSAAWSGNGAFRETRVHTSLKFN